MKLLIISNMAHYEQAGQIVGHGPTAREISYLGALFERVDHIACLHPGPAPLMMLPYTSENVHLIPVPPAGGEGLGDKLSVLRLFPLYLKTILRELPQADVVHIRAPANISLLATLLLTVVSNPKLRWVKYAGNWRPTTREAWSYTVQRFWLNTGLHRGRVTVNGQWPNQPGHVYSFLNPCLTDAELEEGKALAAQRHLSQPLRLLFVGQLNSAKGIGRALHILAELQRKQIHATFDLVGDGPERSNFEALAASLNVRDQVTFHGWLPRPALGPFYTAAHILLFPTSSSEGWPKVLSEAMAYGVVPVSGNVSSIPQYLERFKTGRAFPPDDISSFVNALVWYVEHPEEWQRDSENATQSAALFSYSKYLDAVRKLLNM